jgi:hypothetical protein
MASRFEDICDSSAKFCDLARRRQPRTATLAGEDERGLSSAPKEKPAAAKNENDQEDDDEGVGVHDVDFAPSITPPLFQRAQLLSRAVRHLSENCVFVPSDG